MQLIGSEPVTNDLLWKPVQLINSEPIIADLFSTLVSKAKLKTRGKCNYISLRAWSPKCRAVQLQQFKQLKIESSKRVIKLVASEFEVYLRAMFGPLRNTVITSVPGGHSKTQLSFAAKLAIELARQSGTTYIKVWENRPMSGSSYPRPKNERPPLQWIAHPRQPVILVDDVVTSGSHMEECLNALRSNGITAIGIAWISGEIRERPKDDVPRLDTPLTVIGNVLKFG